MLPTNHFKGETLSPSATSFYFNFTRMASHCLNSWFHLFHLLWALRPIGLHSTKNIVLRGLIVTRNPHYCIKTWIPRPIHQFARSSFVFFTNFLLSFIRLPCIYKTSLSFLFTSFYFHVRTQTRARAKWPAPPSCPRLHIALLSLPLSGTKPMRRRESDG